MTGAAGPAADTAACRAALESARARPEALDPALLRTLTAAPQAALDAALRDFEKAHGAAALSVVERLAAAPAARAVRKVARRSLYRLRQLGVAPAPVRGARPVVERRAEGASRAWISGVDGSGSRAVWVLFEGGVGSATLCSLIVNDVEGILEIAGGDVTKKRLERELRVLRASQKLPWIETEPARAVALVHAALARHRERGTAPPSGFERWRRLFERERPAAATAPPAAPDPALAARATELLQLPELAGWFLDPAAAHADALEILQSRESRLVVSEQVKAEREAEIAARVAARELGPEARARWADRLCEMAYVFDATARPELARIALAAAAALPDADPARDPFLSALARRGIEYAGEVATGRVRADEVSRAPQRRAGRG